MLRRLLVLVLTAWLLAFDVLAYLSDVRGPRFTLEPPPLLVFSNSSGGRADCKAEGSPTPRVEWVLGNEGSPVGTVQGARFVLANGSLVFPPFDGERYRPDVHSATYRCTATNSAGRVASPEVHVRAVVVQSYEARVYDAQVLPGNTAVFRCHVPTFVRDFLTVTSWLQDHTFNIYPTAEGDSKHVMLPSGELHVVSVAPGDSHSSYKCRTLHRLTGHSQESATSGRLLITEPKGPVAPRLTEKSPNVVTGRRGEDLVIPCVAQGYPPPKYWWHRKIVDGNQRVLEPISPTIGERRSFLGGSLHLRSIQQGDDGFYVCSANSSAGDDSAEVRVRVMAELSVHIVPASLRADSGASATFQCVTSTAATTVVWLKDGQRVIQHEGGGGTGAGTQLVIPAVQREDQGMYQCLASFEGETLQATAELRLGASRPQLVYKFIEQTLQPGPDVSLKCVAAGQPTPQMQWSLDGFPLPVSDRFVIGQYVTVSGDVISHVNISKVAVEDGGTYECAASNRVGRTGHAAPLRVYGMPIIRKMPAISAVAGESLVVICPAAGFPIHTVTWEKDGRVLPINHRQTVHPNGTLHVENVQQKVDQGKYTCQASNRQKHSDRGSVDINVMEPPSITPFSIENSARVGERLGLQCLVTKGDSPLSIQWLKDDADVTSLELPALVVRGLGQFSSTLLIEQLSTVHGGRYTCQARNAAATVTHSVTLRVNVPPEITPFSFSELAEGARVQVACTVHRGDLPLNLTWLKNWAPLPQHVHVTPFNTYSSILTMSSVRRGDSGNYTCEARNPARASTHTAQLTISVPPEWVVEPRDVSAIAGHAIVLHCQAEGFPQPTVKWRKAHGKQASQFDDVEASLKNGTLVLNHVQESDEGYYLCEANNGIGAGLSAVVFLTVNALPRFVVALKRETVRKGTAANFLCEAVGDLPMQVVWRHNGIRMSADLDHRIHIKESVVDSSAMSQLTIRHVTAEDSGKYICIASNPFGKDETVVQLLVQDVPDAPTDVRIIERGSRDVKISWNEPADGNSPILYYSVACSEDPDVRPDPQESGDLKTWTKLSNLTPATTYYVHVSAVNQLGAGPVSASVSVTTEPEIPSGPPLDVAVTPVGPHELEVTWDMPSPKLRNGPILGYYIGLMKVSGGSEGRYNYTTVKMEDASPWVFRGLTSFTEYKVTVQAFNAVGAGPSSPGEIATTLESAPDAPPQDLQCSAAKARAQSLAVNWSPPPQAAHNGHILGYQIFFQDAGSPEEPGIFSELPEHGKSTVETTEEKTVIDGLKHYHNYTIQAAAYTAVGVGPVSKAIACTTPEDVPSAPANVRAALSSPRSAIVSWTRPSRANGVLIRYNVYEREIRRGQAAEPARRTVAAHKTHYESANLRENSVYEWYVTAATRVGEGPSTPVQALTPSARVPAAILTFPTHLVLAWKSDATFHCHAVGNPRPDLQWTFNKHRLETGARTHVWNNGTVHITALGTTDSGNYTCSAKNVHHYEKLVHSLLVLVPPPAPTLEVVSITSSNITLSIAHKTSGEDDVLGYVLRYRAPPGEWTEEHLPQKTSKTTVRNLECGTSYQLTIAAYNRVGLGDSEPTLTVKTLGDKPVAPERPIAISSSLQTITVHLDRWHDGECPISHFLVEHRSASQQWITATDSAVPGQSYTIFGLEPATFHNVRVTANNRRGATVTELKVSTLGGVNRSPVGLNPESGPREKAPILADLRISLPIAGSILALVLTFTTVTICLRKKPAGCASSNQPNESSAGPKPDYYSVLHKHSDNQHHPTKANPQAIAADIITPDYGDDIYPYATFQVQKPVGSVSSHRGFQTFEYQGPGAMGVDTYAAREADDYTNVRQPFRSDTEDYDSLGSESDGQGDCHAASLPSAYLQSNIRHSRLVSMLESSTSNEVTPSPNRKLQPKKCRIKSHSPKKKLILRGDTRGMKETAFTFPNHQHVKISDELSEAECDHGSPYHSSIQYRV